MSNVTLLHYNNYFNRTIKKLETVAEYKAADTVNSVAQYRDIASINFVPGDNVTTTIVLGTTDLALDYDYLLVTHTNTSVTPNVEVIDSRWFIMDEQRTRDGQYEVTLRRDVIADNLDEVLTADTYVEKGWLGADNPLIYNKESPNLNQIKKEEILLKDRSNCPWLVAYIAKGSSQAQETINYSPANNNYIEVSANTIAQWEYYGYTNTPFIGPLWSFDYIIWWQAGSSGFPWYQYYCTSKVTMDGGSAILNDSASSFTSFALRATYWAKKADVTNKLLTAFKSIGIEKFNQAASDLVDAHSDSDIQKLMSYNNKIIKTQDGKYYNVQVKSAGVYSVSKQSLVSGNQLYSLMSSACSTSGAFLDDHKTPDADSFKYSCKANSYTVIISEIEAFAVKAKISGTHNKTRDAVYDIVCAPYGDIYVGHGNGNQYIVDFQTKKEIEEAAMLMFAEKLSTGLYDLQLLPYCPIQELIENEGMLSIDTTASTKSFDYIIDNSTSNNVGIVFYVSNSNFTLNIPQSMSWDTYQYITGFTNIEVPGGWTPTLNQYQDYALQRITTTLTGIQVDDMGQYNIQTALGNYILVKKINKVTGKVMDSYMAAKLIVQINTDQSTNYFKIQNLVNGSFEDIPGEYWTVEQYTAANYYIVWQLTYNIWGGRGVDTVWVDLARIPLYDSEFSESLSRKLDNECNMYRIVSPNYQGQFEFSLAKNSGVNFFNVDCTYKPYNPYIHVNPDFKNMYGTDFDDSRGLICNGDFSYGRVNDPFDTYELQNKNYQAIFDRQIQNLDVNNAINREEAKWQMGAGTVQGAATGAATGFIATGNPYVAIGGAVVGAGASLTGGAKDLINQSARFSEAKTFAADMYNYSLQNIKALPYSLTKCTAKTYNNKIYPFVEKYSCTEQEETAMINKIKLDGMSVMAIGKIQDYNNQEGTMIRGEIIRFTSDFKNDNHVAEEIYKEIKKGVYL